jgi:uncharacterized membrane protein
VKFVLIRVLLATSETASVEVRHSTHYLGQSSLYRRLSHGISKGFLYANGFLLLTITVFPFPTAVLAEYINSKFATAAVAIYSLACLLINVAFVIWWSAMQKPVYLIRPEISKHQIKKILTELWIGIIIYIFATVISFWFPFPGSS